MAEIRGHIFNFSKSELVNETKLNLQTDYYVWKQELGWWLPKSLLNAGVDDFDGLSMSAGALMEQNLLRVVKILIFVSILEDWFSVFFKLYSISFLLPFVKNWAFK